MLPTQRLHAVDVGLLNVPIVGMRTSRNGEYRLPSKKFRILKLSNKIIDIIRQGNPVVFRRQNVADQTAVRYGRLNTLKVNPYWFKNGFEFHTLHGLSRRRKTQCLLAGYRSSFSKGNRLQIILIILILRQCVYIVPVVTWKSCVKMHKITKISRFITGFKRQNQKPLFNLNKIRLKRESRNVPDFCPSKFCSGGSWQGCSRLFHNFFMPLYFF